MRQKKRNKYGGMSDAGVPQVRTGGEIYQASPDRDSERKVISGQMAKRHVLHSIRNNISERLMMLLVLIVLGLCVDVCGARPVWSSRSGCARVGANLLQGNDRIPSFQLQRKLMQDDVLSGTDSDTQIVDSETLPETVEIDSTSLNCMPSFNTYFFPFANGNRQVTDPRSNIKTTSQECCASCFANKRCNAWQWCPVEVGCSLANTTGKSLSNSSFPYLGCQLMDLEGFSPYLFDMSNVKSKGEKIPFIAGAPLNISFSEVEGYTEFPGNELGRLFDYQCDLKTIELEANFTGALGCVINGTIEQIADVCTNEGSCKAFVYYPKGFNPLMNSEPVGVLKSGDIEAQFYSEVELNPDSVVYVKDGLLDEAAVAIEDNLRTESTGGSDSTSTAVIAIVATIVGLALIAGLISMVYYIRRYRNMMRSFPTERAVEDGYKMDTDGSGELHDGIDRLGGSGDSEPNTSESGSEMVSSMINSSFGSPRFKRPPIPPNGMSSPGMPQVVVVSELPTGGGSSSGTSMRRSIHSGSAPSSMAMGSSARELMDAFSQMYKQRPAVDYKQLGSLLEDEEAKAAATLEAAVEESRGSTPRSGSLRSTRIPSAIANESTGLAEAYLVDDWSIPPEDVEVCRRPDGTWWQLGTGGFGTVYKGLYHGIHPVAIKILHHIEEEKHKDAFIREALLLKALRHKNVVQFLGASLDGPSATALLVTELMELGDLWRALSAKDPSGERIFSWYSRGRQCMIDVARGLHYLHSKRVVHFDLKSANILLSRAGTAKLADIGMARVLNKSYLSVISGMGTFAWSAPEVLAGKRCTEKADIFSWGVVLWEICTGEAPARGDMRPLQAPEDCPQEIVDLYQRCISEDPDDRPSALELLEAMDARG